jgi:hypothetical protein
VEERGGFAGKGRNAGQQLLTPRWGVQSSVGFDCATELPLEAGKSVRAITKVSTQVIERDIIILLQGQRRFH